jgi:5'-nucleotidase
MMRILITNDDGIYSPGIAALAHIARQFGEVRIVAPDVEQSSMGHAITHSRPLSYKSSLKKFEGIEAYRVNGTPADCVALGNSVWHSGTLAAARQATLLGIPGIALSTPVGKSEPDFEKLRPYVEAVLNQLFINKLQGLYNINFPENPKGIAWTSQSVRMYDGTIVPGIDPLGRKHYWITVKALEPADQGTDRWAMENDLVSITPLSLNLTDFSELNNRKD